MPEVAVSVITLAFGDEPLLGACVDAVLGSGGADVEHIVVDNGCAHGEVDRLGERPGLVVVRPGRNTGFAGGCNLGARTARGDVLVLVNSDALVTPGAVAALARAASDPTMGIATASVRLLERPDVVNSVGNPVHFSGLSWAGGLGEPAVAHAEAREVASASGCAMAMRREVWDELEGFCEDLFAYCEDTELSLRCRLAGLRVGYVPDAVVLHDYQFSRHPHKNYLLERNRLFVLLTVYRPRTLLLLAPPLLGLELAVLAVAVREGWAGQKLRGWWWLVTHAAQVRRRRAWVQAARRQGDRGLVGVLTGDFAPGPETGVSAPTPVRLLSRGYWALVRGRLR